MMNLSFQFQFLKKFWKFDSKNLTVVYNRNNKESNVTKEKIKKNLLEIRSFLISIYIYLYFKFYCSFYKRFYIHETFPSQKQTFQFLLSNYEKDIILPRRFMFKESILTLLLYLFNI